MNNSLMARRWMAVGGILAGLALGGAAAAWSLAAGGHTQQQPHPRAARAVTAGSRATVPMTFAAARSLPAGVFYILGGPNDSSRNVWEVSRSGTLLQLTHNPAGAGIDEMSASPAGIVVGDGLYGGEQDGMVTGHGVVWVRPWHKPRGFIYGFGIRITATGQLLYLLAPGQGTDPSSKVFTYWLKPSLTGQEHQIYRSPAFIGGPLPGPGGRVALVGPSGPVVTGPKPGIVILSRSGHARSISPGVKALGYPPLWGQTVPALVIPPVQGPAHLVYLNGRRETLPQGWQPWSWNPSGNALLMLRGTTLGIWSAARPGQVTPVTQITPGFEIEDISWLTHQAKF